MTVGSHSDAHAVHQHWWTTYIQSHERPELSIFPSCPLCCCCARSLTPAWEASSAHVTTAPALFSPNKWDFPLHSTAEFQQDRWTVFCIPCLRIQKLVHCPATGRQDEWSRTPFFSQCSNREKLWKNMKGNTSIAPNCGKNPWLFLTHHSSPLKVAFQLIEIGSRCYMLKQNIEYLGWIKSNSGKTIPTQK